MSDVCGVEDHFTTFSLQDGMVRFDRKQENYSSPVMLRLLEDQVTAAMALDSQVTGLEEEIMVSSAYVKKTAGGRNDEDEEAGGSRMSSFNNAVSASS